MDKDSVGVMATDPKPYILICFDCDRDLASRRLWHVSLKIHTFDDMVGVIRPMGSYGSSAL